MAKAKTTAPAPRRSWFWLQGVICGGVAAMVPGTALVIAVLLAPGLAICATERTAGRPIARAMILMGVAASFMPLRLLWEQGGTLDQAFEVLGNPARLLLAWCASGFGWMVGQLTETVSRYALEFHAQASMRGLVREKADLTKEWNDLEGS